MHALSPRSHFTKAAKHALVNIIIIKAYVIHWEFLLIFWWAAASASDANASCFLNGPPPHTMLKCDAFSCRRISFLASRCFQPRLRHASNAVELMPSRYQIAAQSARRCYASCRAPTRMPRPKFSDSLLLYCFLHFQDVERALIFDIYTLQCALFDIHFIYYAFWLISFQQYFISRDYAAFAAC